MTSLAGSPLAGKLGRFASVGVVATLLYAGLGLVFAHGFGLAPMVTTVVAYALAAVFSYTAHRSVTFRSDRTHAVAVPRFAVATACGFGLAALLTLTVERLGLPYAVGVGATCLAVPVFNFVVLDRLVFASTSQRGSAS
ncbi:GtrA family protein [Chelatococcus sambhunathii]|uniref:GtrA family protein n=1 Tax=Chelatococcus sambhunathii TaxID=363953 RepID=A0ABU1DEC6_9HYPH|nr:GtrA family protein [Chelatococcus sambhunathii]MDR4306388.1 GtrA family protein [Chelatococcus sambhunathii]